MSVRIARLPPPLLWPALAFLTVFYLYPLADMLRLSVTEPVPGLGNFVRLLASPLYIRVFLNSFEIAALVSAIALVLGYVTAYLLATIDPRRARLLLACIMVPFFTGILVRNYAWIFMLGANGVVNATLRSLGLITAPLSLIYNRLGVVIALVHVLLPYTVLVLLGAMRGIDPRLLHAAASLGSSRFGAFRRVFLPLTLPGAGGAFLLVFVIALASFVTPAMLGGPNETMVAGRIADEIGLLNWGFAAALATMLLLASLVLIGLAQRLFGGFSLIAPGTARRPGRQIRAREGRLAALFDTFLTPLWPGLPYLLGGATLVFLVLPILIALPISLNAAPYLVFPPERYSLRWYIAFFDNPDWLDAAWNSARIAVLTTALTMALAMPAAMAIARARSRWARAAYALILSPMVLPGVIVAIALFMLLSRLGLTGTILGVVLGHAVVCLPLATVVLVAALQGFDRNLERAAASLAAGPLCTFWRVTLPCIATAGFTAAFLAFLHSFDELLISVFVSGINARTLPKKMWESLQEINPIIAAVSSLLVLLSITVVLVTALLRRPAARADSAL